MRGLMGSSLCVSWAAQGECTRARTRTTCYITQLQHPHLKCGLCQRFNDDGRPKALKSRAGTRGRYCRLGVREGAVRQSTVDVVSVDLRWHCCVCVLMGVGTNENTQLHHKIRAVWANACFMVRFMYASLSSCVNVSGRGDAAAFIGAPRENAEEPYRRDFAYLPETGLVAAAVAGRDGVWELLLTSTAGAAIARAPLADVIRWRLSLATGTGDAASRFVSISGSEVTLVLEVLCMHVTGQKLRRAWRPT